ncbi:MAG: glycoside hydrolase family 2 [Clostridia bacterium]|nr:glycoside hydrolase family 2 [Clostridia bacterium]
MGKFAELYTEEGLKMPKIPWDVYPRPMMRRDSFLCLNGEWDFSIKYGKEECIFEKITVPFSPETLLSGIEADIPEENYDSMVYRKSFSIDEGFDRGRILLHFGAVSNYAEITFNGKTVGIHRGAYDSFSFDVTSLVKKDNIIEVYAKNILNDKLLPYGKQSRKRGGMWYTPTSGIWQTVWLESVPLEYIKNIETCTDSNRVTVKAEGIDKGRVQVYTDNGTIEYEMKGGECVFEIESPRLWSPDDPYLYNFSVETETDRVESYFAFRTVEIKEKDGYKRIFLNGKPIFFHGLLDQGYWSDGGMTPPSPESYAYDIEKMKSLGFNMLRKHIKIEPQQFYYDCDRLGMIVFQDMVNNGSYSFIRDTALPTVGWQNRSDKKMHKDNSTREMFIEGMEKTVKALKNHPCICCWTIFNEGWGQFCGTEMYGRLKKLDDSRIIDTASGWFSKVESDVESKHVYFRKAKLKAGKKPLVLSEFGGYSYRVEGHIFNPDREYGYGKYKNRDEFARAFCELYKNEIIPLAKKGLCASVYTQVSDVEDETNGLLTFDRRVLKVTPEEFLPISEELKNCIE